MTFWEPAGYFASTLVVIAFCMKDIVSLRIVAIASNLAFLTYGIGLSLPPVWLLHAVLLPVNAWRLFQALAGRNKIDANVLSGFQKKAPVLASSLSPRALGSNTRHIGHL